jgi:hypothetical protein
VYNTKEGEKCQANLLHRALDGPIGRVLAHVRGETSGDIEGVREINHIFVDFAHLLKDNIQKILRRQSLWSMSDEDHEDRRTMLVNMSVMPSMVIVATF